MTSPTLAHHLTSSLPGILHTEALRDPERTVLTALDRDGKPVATLTAGEFDLGARSLASDLLSVAAPGDRVLLPAMPGLRFQIAFLACLYARLVAVPVPPIRMAAAPRGGARSSRFSRLLGICQDVEPAVAVVPGGQVEELAADWAGCETLGELRLLDAEPRNEADPVLAPEPVAYDELAFLQYTSGSTAAPRGVMITHGAMFANQAMLYEHMGVTQSTTAVSWLPLYHDMGLCLGLLQPVYARCAAVIFEPETFIVRPELWLQVISGLADPVSAAPNSAYEWCAKRVREEAKADLDLSRWRVSVNGAEPVRADTLRAFQAAFAGCALSERVITPAYGLAEATLFVTAGSGLTSPVVCQYDRQALGRGRAVPAAGVPGAAGSVEMVGCGRPGPGIRVAVVDPETRRAFPARVVGEIWVRSPSNGSGYWRRPEESGEVFGAMLADVPDGQDERWLRTGDLGFLDNGELFISGRRKDLIVIHGVNYYPQDFEQLVQQAHPLLDGELAAACAAEDEERVTVVVEIASRCAMTAPEAAYAAVRAVTAELPVTTDVVVIPRGQLPRTTSGKARRRECAMRLWDGQLSVLAQWPRDTS